MLLLATSRLRQTDEQLTLSQLKKILLLNELRHGPVLDLRPLFRPRVAYVVTGAAVCLSDEDSML